MAQHTIILNLDAEQEAALADTLALTNAEIQRRNEGKEPDDPTFEPEFVDVDAMLTARFMQVVDSYTQQARHRESARVAAEYEEADPTKRTRVRQELGINGERAEN